MFHLGVSGFILGSTKNENNRRGTKNTFFPFLRFLMKQAFFVIVQKYQKKMSNTVITAARRLTDISLYLTESKLSK